MENISLFRLFQENEMSLRYKLSGLKMPMDKDKLKDVLSSMSSELFNQERFSTILTPSQFAVFQSALKIVESSFGMSSALLNWTEIEQTLPEPYKQHNTNSQTENIKKIAKKFTPAAAVVSGILVGAKPSIATILLCTILLGIDYFIPSNTKEIKESDGTNKDVIAFSIDVDQCLNRVGSICVEIDRLMNIFTSEVETIKASVSTKPVTLASNYGYLIERLSDLYVNKLLNTDVDIAIDKLFKTLKNYHYEFLEYSEANEHLFEVTLSSSAKELELLSPAILENGNCISSGKVIKPE